MKNEKSISCYIDFTKMTCLIFLQTKNSVIHATDLHLIHENTCRFGSKDLLELFLVIFVFSQTHLYNDRFSLRVVFSSQSIFVSKSDIVNFF